MLWCGIAGRRVTHDTGSKRQNSRVSCAAETKPSDAAVSGAMKGDNRYKGPHRVDLICEKLKRTILTTDLSSNLDYSAIRALEIWRRVSSAA